MTSTSLFVVSTCFRVSQLHSIVDSVVTICFFEYIFVHSGKLVVVGYHRLYYIKV